MPKMHCSVRGGDWNWHFDKAELLLVPWDFDPLSLPDPELKKFSPDALLAVPWDDEISDLQGIEFPDLSLWLCSSHNRAFSTEGVLACGPYIIWFDPDSFMPQAGLMLAHPSLPYESTIWYPYEILRVGKWITVGYEAENFNTAFGAAFTVVIDTTTKQAKVFQWGNTFIVNLFSLANGETWAWFNDHSGSAYFGRLQVGFPPVIKGPFYAKKESHWSPEGRFYTATPFIAELPNKETGLALTLSSPGFATAEVSTEDYDDWNLSLQIETHDMTGSRVIANFYDEDSSYHPFYLQSPFLLHKGVVVVGPDDSLETGVPNWVIHFTGSEIKVFSDADEAFSFTSVLGLCPFEHTSDQMASDADPFPPITRTVIWKWHTNATGLIQDQRRQTITIVGNQPLFVNEGVHYLHEKGPGVLSKELGSVLVRNSFHKTRRSRTIDGWSDWIPSDQIEILPPSTHPIVDSPVMEPATPSKVPEPTEASDFTLRPVHFGLIRRSG